MTCPDGLDQIHLKGISGHGHHGVFPEERERGQYFSVDVSIGLDLEQAGRTDDLSATVDYGALAKGVHEIVIGAPLNLIESVALRVVDLCLERDVVRWASVTVHKPGAPIDVPFSDVSVTTERSKK